MADRPLLVNEYKVTTRIHTHTQMINFLDHVTYLWNKAYTKINSLLNIFFLLGIREQNYLTTAQGRWLSTAETLLPCYRNKVNIIFTALNSILHKVNVYDKTYRVIQEERSIFLEVIVSVIVRQNSSCEHVSNSERLTRQNCLNPQIQEHCKQ